MKLNTRLLQCWISKCILSDQKWSLEIVSSHTGAVHSWKPNLKACAREKVIFDRTWMWFWTYQVILQHSNANIEFECSFFSVFCSKTMEIYFLRRYCIMVTLVYLCHSLLYQINSLTCLLICHLLSLIIFKERLLLCIQFCSLLLILVINEIGALASAISTLCNAEQNGEHFVFLQSSIICRDPLLGCKLLV